MFAEGHELRVDFQVNENALHILILFNLILVFFDLKIGLNLLTDIELVERVFVVSKGVLEHSGT